MDNNTKSDNKHEEMKNDSYITRFRDKTIEERIINNKPLDLDSIKTNNDINTQIDHIKPGLL